jgi:hypothetical protein
VTADADLFYIGVSKVAQDNGMLVKIQSHQSDSESGILGISIAWKLMLALRLVIL